jgi:hypothetical protein
MTSRITYLLTATLCAAACGAADGPDVVAEAFWRASKEGDAELAKTYMAEGGSASINDDRNGSSIGDYSLGETAIDGQRATVETTITSSGEQEMVIDFTTVLVQQDGSWKVDLDQTTDAMMQSLLGTTMSGMAEQMGEAMGEAMKGMAEGMAEGLQSMGDALEDSLKTAGR